MPADTRCRVVNLEPQFLSSARAIVFLITHCNIVSCHTCASHRFLAERSSESPTTFTWGQNLVDGRRATMLVDEGSSRQLLAASGSISLLSVAHSKSSRHHKTQTHHTCKKNATKQRPPPEMQHAVREAQLPVKARATSHALACTPALPCPSSPTIRPTPNRSTYARCFPSLPLTPTLRPSSPAFTPSAPPPPHQPLPPSFATYHLHISCTARRVLLKAAAVSSRFWSLCRRRTRQGRRQHL
jgi:hypothetical protein